MAPTGAAETAIAAGKNSNGVILPSDDIKFLASRFAFKFIVPMALKAVIELGIPDILAKAKGRKPLSAEEILVQLPTKSAPGPNSISNLRRLLRPVVHEGFFSKSLNDKKEPVYGLTKISEWFIKDNQLSLRPLALLHYTSTFLTMWSHLQDLILDENATPFDAEHGVPFYVYGQQHPDFRAKFDDMLVSESHREVKEVVDVLQQSGVLEGVKTLVDVGGGAEGLFVGAVVAENPHIQGINFELPHVIATSPEVNGVKHIAGDFFEAIPTGDAVLLKYIIHNHGDEASIKILKNCFEALPKNGKVVIVDLLLNEEDPSVKSRYVDDVDLVMLGITKGARERTDTEYQKLLEAAGFSQVHVFKRSGGMDLIQAFKK